MMQRLLFIFSTITFSLNGQTSSSDILDGTKLLNIKKADPAAFYKYDITDDCYTLLKFKKGNVADYRFYYPKGFSLKTDTSYHLNNSGINILLKNNQLVRLFNELHINYKNDGLYLTIAARDSLTKNFDYGNIYFYYSNRQLSSIYIKNRDNKSTNNIRYTRKGILSSIENLDSLNKMIDVIFYTKTGEIDWKMRVKDGITVREQYDGKGNLLQIDSTNAVYEHIGTLTTYYNNKNIKSKTPFINDKVSGTYYYYYKNGNIKVVENYIADKKNGKYIYYNKDGTIKKEGVYK